MQSFLAGIILGSLVGFLLAFIAYKHQLPKWKKQGFARGKTPEEKLIVKNYYESENYKKDLESAKQKWHDKSILWPAAIIGLTTLIGIGIIPRTVSGVEIIPTLFFASITFMFVLIGGFVLIGFLVDDSVRKLASDSKNAQTTTPVATSTIEPHEKTS